MDMAVTAPAVPMSKSAPEIKRMLSCSLSWQQPNNGPQIAEYHVWVSFDHDPDRAQSATGRSTEKSDEAAEDNSYLHSRWRWIGQAVVERFRIFELEVPAQCSVVCISVQCVSTALIAQSFKTVGVVHVNLSDLHASTPRT